jgi:hypothetical protein
MFVGAPPLALRLVLWRFLQVNFQSVQVTDGVEPVPGLIETKADLLVVRDRAFKVVDEELWSKEVTPPSSWLQTLTLPFPGRQNRAPAAGATLSGRPMRPLLLRYRPSVHTQRFPTWPHPTGEARVKLHPYHPAVE